MFFTACSLFLEEDTSSNNKAEGLFQSVLETNESGYFAQDYTYTFYNYGRYLDNYNNAGEDIYLNVKAVKNFKSDGSYTLREYGYEDGDFDLDNNGITGEGFILITVENGTYTYKDYKLTITSIDYLNHVEWIPDENNIYYDTWNSNPEVYVQEYAWINTRYTYITENIFRDMYKNSGQNTWVSMSEYYREDSTDDVSQYLSTYTITTSDIRFTYSSDYREEEEVFEIFDTFPNNQEFTEGSIVKFNGIYTTARERYFDYETETFGEWENSWSLGDLRDITFAHMGDFIVWDYAITDYSRGIK